MFSKDVVDTKKVTLRMLVSQKSRRSGLLWEGRFVNPTHPTGGAVPYARKFSNPDSQSEGFGGKYTSKTCHQRHDESVHRGEHASSEGGYFTWVGLHAETLVHRGPVARSAMRIQRT